MHVLYIFCLEVKPEEEEIIAKPFTVDVKVSTDYDETAL